MNTVLDDNKKLCLNSGQIINLTDQMTMMFEVEDLAVASPATVSRCGMVYLEPGAIGDQPLIDSWIKTCPDTFKKAKKLLPTLDGYFKKYLGECLKFVRRYCSEPVITVNNNLVQSQLRILDCYFADYHESEVKKVSQEDVEELEEMMEHLFIFSIVWSIGVTTTTEGRQKFNDKLRKIIPDKLGYPAEGSVYDYCYSTKKKEWQKWTETVPDYQVDTKQNYLDITVPTFDSIRMQFITRLLLLNKKHVLSPGPTGTGKTVNISSLLASQMPEDYAQINIGLSAQTSAQ